MIRRENVILRFLESHPNLSDPAPLFLFAASQGFAMVVEQLLAGDPSIPNADAGYGQTPLHLAAAGGHIAVVKQILAASPTSINAVNKQGLTALHLAAKQGQGACVECLLAAKPALINATASEGQTALHVASCHGQSAAVELLLAASPTAINAVTNQRWTALHFAVPTGHHTVVEQLLAANPALIDAVTENGMTALHHAVVADQLSLTEKLFGASPASINAVTPSDGWTVLHLAALRGGSEMAERLLALSPSLIDAVAFPSGWTVLHCAVSSERKNVPSVARALLAVKPELISMIDLKGNTVLHMVAGTCQSKEFIEEMWRLYPEALRAANFDDATPFHVAIENQNGIAIEVLQLHLTWEEIISANDRCKLSAYEERFRPVMEAQCESLWSPDVAKTVFEYLGFRVKRAKCGFTF